MQGPLLKALAANQLECTRRQSRRIARGGNMFEHHDALEDLNKHISLRDKLIVAHKSAAELFPFIARIAITLYDAKAKMIKAFLYSGDDGMQFDHRRTLLDDAPALREIMDKRLPRIIDGQLIFEGNIHDGSDRIGHAGYAASYTMPMFNDGEFIGFIFFNTNETDVFTESALRQIDIYGHLIALMVIKELISAQMLLAAVNTTGHLTHVRDPETGSHLDRMSRYSRLIASELADKYRFDDNYIEHVFMFSPLHDIGKIGIPDNILLKPGKLDANEMTVMKTHARKGWEIIEELLNNFGLENFEYIDVLRNIALFHHEAFNGSGYPVGLQGNEIPLEARIVAVADVFDALTSKRPYKPAWSNEKAIEMLIILSGEQLDRECVDALVKNMDEVEKIQQQFKENDYG
jgi:HD-GYP domain-containing protein (c-di-GMP phosphodiesterase class II)